MAGDRDEFELHGLAKVITLKHRNVCKDGFELVDEVDSCALNFFDSPSSFVQLICRLNSVPRCAGPVGRHSSRPDISESELDQIEEVWELISHSMIYRKIVNHEFAVSVLASNKF
jgi:hypothetical protein